MNESKNDTNRWRDTPCSWLGRSHCENDCTTQSNLQIQYNPYQITKGIFHRIRIPQIGKAILRKKNEVEEPSFLISDYTMNLQSSWQYGTLAQKQKYRSVKLDTKRRNKPTHLWSPNLWQRRQEYIIKKCSVFNK